jgi:hypothetical protein
VAVCTALSSRIDTRVYSCVAVSRACGSKEVPQLRLILLGDLADPPK